MIHQRGRGRGRSEETIFGSPESELTLPKYRVPRYESKSEVILELIREINQKLGITVIIITHQMSVVESTCRHVAILEEGQVVEQGEVSAVFSHPKSEAARRLVFPEGNPESLLCSLPGSRLIRVVFNGADATGKPIIARMATEIGVEANIAYASTRSIERHLWARFWRSF